MAAKTAKPLKSLLPFGKPVIHSVDGKYNYAILGLNTGNTNAAYDFSDGEFKITLLTAGGYMDGETPWLLATIPADNIGDLLNYEVRVNTGGSWATDKPATEKIIEDWKSTNCLIAIKVDNIPVLKALVKSLIEHTLFVTCTLRVNLAISEDKVPDISEKLGTYFNFVKENKKPLPSKEDTDNYMAIGILNKYMGVPQVSFLGLPEKDELDPEYGIPTGNKIAVSVPFTGEYPFSIEKLIFSPPEISTNGTGKKSWGGGTSVNVEGYSSDNAWKFIKENYDDINEFFKSKMPSIVPSQVISISLSLAGVQVLPRLYPNAVDNYQPMIPIETVPVEEELKQIKQEIAPEVSPLKAQVEAWFKKNKIKSELWLEKHNTEQEYKLFLAIVNSEIYRRKPEDVKAWVGTKLGMVGSAVPITALGDLHDLMELHSKCELADTKLKIDQDTTIE